MTVLTRFHCTTTHAVGDKMRHFPYKRNGASVKVHVLLSGRDVLNGILHTIHDSGRILRKPNDSARRYGTFRQSLPSFKQIFFVQDLPMHTRAHLSRASLVIKKLIRKGTAKHLCVTTMTGLLLARFFVTFTCHYCVLVFCKLKYLFKGR